MKTDEAMTISGGVLLNLSGSSRSSSSPVSDPVGDDARVLKYKEKKSTNAVWRDKPPFFLLQNLLTSSQQSHSSLSSCCCSLPVPVNVFKHLDTSFSHSKLLSQLPTPLRSGSGSGSGYSALSRPLCFRISTRLSGVCY